LGVSSRGSVDGPWSMGMARHAIETVTGRRS
jgi:hypothetical protein